MAKWNEIPFNNDADPETKADEFDRQFAENKADSEAKGDNSNPYTRENFNK